MFVFVEGLQDFFADDTTRRRLDPYGSPRTATAADWPSTRGFVNGTIDNTSLTHLGAREYEPATGRFISDDPVTDPSDPQQINGYVYAVNNPIAFSDSTGLSYAADSGGQWIPQASTQCVRS